MGEERRDGAAVSRRGFVAAGGAAVAGLAAAPLASQAEARPRRFEGRVVLITGATSGIGRGTAEAFAREGARVCFCGRREALGREVEAGIRAGGGEAAYVRADVRVEDDVRRFVEACVERWGRIDVAFNNAGVATPRSAPVHEQPTADFLDVMATNTLGVFLSLKHQLPHLLRNEPRQHGLCGVVVNNASVSGHVGFARIAPYSASKHAIVGLTRSAAIEYGPRGVRVVSISPGGVDTPMRRQAYAAQGLAPDAAPPPVPNFARRVNTVDEIARAVLFLASDDATSVYGADLDVTGGMLTGAHFTPAA